MAGATVIFFFGTATYGRIDRVGDTHVATLFFHVFGVPLLPLGSVVVVDGERTAIPLVARSVIAAYLRTWTLVGALAMALSWAPAWWILVHSNGPTPSILALLGLAFWAWRGLGHLGSDARRHRLAYARATGVAVDPKLLVRIRPQLRAELRAATPAPDAGYRDADPDAWIDVALASADPRALAFALTRARLENRRDAHARIAAKLRTLAE